MARIRTLKPEFFRSRSLAKLPREARLTFAGLWTEADDHGRGVADPRILKGAIWPLDDDITHEHVSAHLSVLAASNHIGLYQVGDETYFEVVKWTEHQAAAYRRGDPKYPSPDAGHSVSELGMQESADDTQMRAGTGNREQGTGNISRSEASSEAFDSFALEQEEIIEPTFEVGSDDDPKWREFWSVVANKDGKIAARETWANHILGKGEYKGKPIPKSDPDLIIAGMRLYASRMKSEGTERKHIKMAQGWLNERRWEDELARQEEFAQSERPSHIAEGAF